MTNFKFIPNSYSNDRSEDTYIKQKKFSAPCEFKGGVKNDIFFYVKIE